ncbi:GNAT family N-acetyltransferase [Rhodococcus sp. NPDC058481]|uniref:GNAT family N-acetyltransferase n=1 Tax=unclassified Rhodococcus (in: high G+C Gram-positive bacteria) TaxID=192944 RepID=UPI00365EC537
MSEEDVATAVLDAPAQHRFEVRVGAELAGFTEYVDRDNQRIFFHTEIGEQYGGRGLASRLIRDALTETVSRGKRIVPICPFVAGFLEKHDDFAADVDPVTPEARQAVLDART